MSKNLFSPKLQVKKLGPKNLVPIRYLGNKIFVFIVLLMGLKLFGPNKQFIGTKLCVPIECLQGRKWILVLNIQDCVRLRRFVVIDDLLRMLIFVPIYLLLHTLGDAGWDDYFWSLKLLGTSSDILGSIYFYPNRPFFLQ